MPREIEMTQNDINNYLSQLGAELATLLTAQGVNETIQILVIGGAYMVTQVQNRETTHDIDAVLLDVLPENIMNDWRSQLLLKAARKVASRNKIPRHWFNDDAALFIAETMRPDRIYYATFGPLEVYVPSRECILASKIMTYRDKDREDINALLQELGIKYRDQAQAIVDRYVPVKRHQLEHLVHRTMQQLFFY
jgi:hypothetical protein